MFATKYNKLLLLSATCVLVGTALSACTSTTQHVPVQDVPPTQGSPVRSSPQGVQNINQLNGIQAEIRELRNLVEEQQFELENLRQRQQDLFQGLDQRLRVSEAMQQGGNVIGPDGTVTSPGMLPPLTAGTQVPAEPGVVEPGNATAPGATSPAVTDPGAPPSTITVGASTPPAAVAGSGGTDVDQQELYDRGFEHLRASMYNEAIDYFTQLVQRYPNGGLADDASYWIGEANYVNRQYEAAIQAFRKVVAQYPQSDRVPEALLKVGYVQYDIGDYKNAKTTFEDVLRRYPDHPVSISAKSRLQRIAQGISS